MRIFMRGRNGKENSVVRILQLIPAAALVLATGLLMTDVPAVAHHSSAPFYDDTKSVDVEGVVTKFIFRNPHSFIYLDVEDETGHTVEYEVEMRASVSMARRGWTPETIRAGDVIRIVGQPSRAPGTHGICCAELTKSDGSPIGPS